LSRNERTAVKGAHVDPASADGIPETAPGSLSHSFNRIIHSSDEEDEEHARGFT
jgi:hypothetical protein